MPQHPSKLLLGRLFDNDELLIWLKDTTGLGQSLGSGAWDDLPSLDRSTEGTTVQLFDQPFTARGNVSARARYLGVGAEVDAFGDGVEAVLRAGANPGVLDVGAGFGLDTELPLHAQAGIQLTARAGLSGNFRYRHYLPATPGDDRLAVLKALVGGSRLPNLLDLASAPEPGEVQRLDLRLGVDLGLDFKAGYQTQTDVTRELGDGLSLAFRTDLSAAVGAALGLSLFDDMVLAVGRAGQIEDGWIRIRLQRRHQRKLTFGTTFSLDLGYDLGTSLAQLFEEAVGQLPIPRLVKTAETVTRTLADAPENNWDTVKARLTGEMEEVLDELVGEVLGLATGDDDWRNWLATDPRIRKVVDFSREVVATYDGLDARVQSLWERILSKTDLGTGSQIRGWLQELAGLADGGFQIEDLITGDAGKWIEAVESLTGSSLEDLVLDGNLGDALREVSSLAQKALAFLDDAPGDAVAKIREFAEKTGIRASVDVLRKLQSTHSLETEVSSRLQKLAGRLVGKAWDKLTQADLQKVSGWAEKVYKLLPDPNADGTEAAKLKGRIATRLRQLKLDYGLSVSFELERVSRSTALLDVELDPGAEHAGFRRDVADALRFGRARQLFSVLADATDMVDDGSSRAEPKELPPPPFLIRESAFTSERIRSSAVSTVFRLIGLGRMLAGRESGFTRRIEQSAIHAVDLRAGDPGVPANRRFRREGRYTAAFQRGDRTADLATEAAIWLVCEDADAAGAKLRGLEDAFAGGEATRSLRLSFSWEDSSAKEREIEALSELVGQLGFQPVAAGQTTPEAALEQGRAVRLALEIRFGADAIQRFLAGYAAAGAETPWNRAYLATAHRWLAEPFVTRDRLPVAATNTRNLGEVLSKLITTPEFRRNWTSVGGFFAALGGKTVELPFPGGTVPVPIGRQNDPSLVTGVLWALIARRKAGLEAVGGPLAGSWTTALGARTPEGYRQLSRVFADSWRKASVHTLRWPNSMFCLWLWLAGLNALDPALLQTATGIATLRWRPGTADPGTNPPAPGGNGGDGAGPEWSEPLVWTLRKGVGVPDNFATGVFVDP